jgi:5'-3' exonuclease, N-terminal resolvase-like domain
MPALPLFDNKTKQKTLFIDENRHLRLFSVPKITIEFLLFSNLIFISGFVKMMSTSTTISTIPRHTFLYSHRRLKLSTSAMMTSKAAFRFDRHFTTAAATSLNLLNRPDKNILIRHQRCEDSMLEAQSHRDDHSLRSGHSYSLDDMKQRNQNGESSSSASRPFPPSLDSQFDEDMGVGELPYNEYDDEQGTDNRQPTDIQSKVETLSALSEVEDDDDDISIEYTPEQLKQINAREKINVKRNSRSFLDDTHNDDDKPIGNEDDKVSYSGANTFAEKVYVPETLESLQERFDKLTREIYALNNGVEFNINASKQVSLALFGAADESTNKDALQVWISTGRYPMASLILEYRSVRSRIRLLQKKENSIKQGTAVQSAFALTKLGSSISKDIKSAEEDPEDPIILIDASSYIFRAYYTMPPIHRGDGMPIGAVMGFCKMLNSLFLAKMLENQQSGKLPPRVVMCFDAKGKTFRHDMFTDYKGNRPPAPIDLIPQFDLVRQAADAYGIHRIEAPYYEADDVIATMATMAFNEGLDTSILSGDKDLMQLVTSPPNDDVTTIQPSIQLIDPATKDRTTYQQVVEKWAVPPNRLGDVLALAGDTADNVPGT